MDEEEKDTFIKNEFQKSWDDLISSLEAKAQIDLMKRSYFDSLLKTF